MRKRLIAALLASLALASMAPAGRAADLATALPRNFDGEFHWLGEDETQRVEMRIETLTQTDPDHLEAAGCGRYEIGGAVTSIIVHFHIEVPTLAVEIWELDPVGAGATSFTTEGSHRGTFSADLKNIDATWTTRATGKQGELHLHAVAHASCANETSAEEAGGQRLRLAP